MVPHFDGARVAAVTGNPRVRNTRTFLARLQAIEFSSIISLLRRAQRVWGRIVTVSGVVVAFRRSAVFDVGGFSPEMPTEDIELTWKLQKRFYDVRYEPRAVCWMTVPQSLRGTQLAGEATKISIPSWRMGSRSRFSPVHGSAGEARRIPWKLSSERSSQRISMASGTSSAMDRRSP